MKFLRLCTVMLLLMTVPLLPTHGQTVVVGPDTLATRTWVRDYIRSLVSPTTPPPPAAVPLPPCTQGPELRAIFEPTPQSLTFQFHGENVFGMSWQILTPRGQVLRSGDLQPKANRITLRYEALYGGTYTLRIAGTTCTGQSEKTFSIAGLTGAIAPSAPARLDAPRSHELFMNLTGYGYNPTEPSGMSHEWVERIEAFKYDWGYGITGIRLCVRWYDWEPTQGQYTHEGIQRVIDYCKARGLKLSVFFWPWRISGDPMLAEDQLMRGHRGTPHQIEGRLRMGSLVSEDINKKLYTAVRALSQQLATYEGAYYVSIGTADAEEFANPVVGLGQSARPELTGFEGIFQAKYQQYLASQGKPFQTPAVVEWDRGVALNMGTESGRDFARFVSRSLTAYFDNFARAVRDGSGGKLLSCYFYPDAGNPQNAWYLHANFATQAQNADAMYGTDGLSRHDNDRKRLCNAINLGMGKISIVEWDPVDLGEQSGYCSALDYAQMEREFGLTYAAGTHVISYAMSFCPDQIRQMEPHLKRLHASYIGKPYRRPDWPVSKVSITPAFWRGQEIYAPSWTGQNFLRPDDRDFLNSSK